MCSTGSIQVSQRRENETAAVVSKWKNSTPKLFSFPVGDSRGRQPVFKSVLVNHSLLPILPAQGTLGGRWCGHSVHSRAYPEPRKVQWEGNNERSPRFLVESAEDPWLAQAVTLEIQSCMAQRQGCNSFVYRSQKDPKFAQSPWHKAKAQKDPCPE